MTLELTKVAVAVDEQAERARSDRTLALVWTAWIGTTGILVIWTVLFRKDAEQASGELMSMFKSGVLAAALVLAVFSLIGMRRAVSTRHLLLGAVAIAPWVIAGFRDAYVSPISPNTGVLYAILVVGIWAGGGTERALRAVGLQTLITVGISIVLGVLAPSLGLEANGRGLIVAVDKSILGLPTLAGMFGSGNNLGAHIALGLPFVFLLRRRWLKWGGVLMCIVAALWTSSRSGLIGVAVCLTALFVIRMVRVGAKRRVAAIGMGLMALVVILLPLQISGQTELSGRGRIWSGSFEALDGNFLFGLGSRWYRQIMQTSAGIGDDAVEGHNQLVQTLVGGGIVLVLAVAALYVCLARHALATIGADGGVAATYVITLLASSMLEAPMGFWDRTMFLDVVAVPILLLVLKAENLPVLWVDRYASNIAATGGGGVKVSRQRPDR